MKNIIKKPLFWVLSIEIVIVLILRILGFKITYNPMLDNNWDAISACAAWVGVLVSGMALLATLAVLYQNHKTIELSKKDIQNAINLQMFDKMMDIANKIESNDYSSTTMELVTLFGQDVLKQVEELRYLKEQEKNKESESSRYYTLLREEEDYDWDLEDYLQKDDAPENMVQEAINQQEKYRILYDPKGFGDEAYYDINEINKELSELKSNVSIKQKQLKNNVYMILRNKFPLN